MNESLSEAAGELRRVDHLVFVSLKYTRTVDVIRSIVNRMLNAIDFMIDALLEHARLQKKLGELPKNKALKAELVKKTYNDDAISEMIDLYTKLKRLLRAEYKASQEYRRHVTMTAITDEGLVDLNIDVMKEHYQKLKEFLRHVSVIIEGEKEEE